MSTPDNAFKTTRVSERTDDLSLDAATVADLEPGEQRAARVRGAASASRTMVVGGKVGPAAGC